MAQVNKPYTFGPNTTISSSNVNDNFDTIYDEFNGNITEANLADDAVTENKIADGSVTSAKLASGLVDNGWVALSGTASVSTGYNKGNREYDLTFNTNLSSTLSPGMRLKLSRGTTPPTQCTDLEASSSQYWSKTSPTGITFTDDFTCEAWIKLESYGEGGIVSRRDSNIAGWSFELSASGQLILNSLRIASNNRNITTYQSLPLNRWVHVAATMDNSANSHTMYIDGISVPFATNTTGTITALVQPSVDLQVGNRDDDNDTFFDGEIADVRVWSAVRTATQIRDNMNQQLVGNETNLVAYFKLNGDGNDSTSNANNLTAQNSATATTVDNPMKSTEYAIVTKVAYSAPNTTVTVFTGTDHNIPNMTLENPFYSTQKAPYGFPVSRSEWIIEVISRTQRSTASTSFVSLTDKITVPTGKWELSLKAFVASNNATSNLGQRAIVSLSSSGTTETNPNLTGQIGGGFNATATGKDWNGSVFNTDFVTTTTSTDYTFIGACGNTSTMIVYSDLHPTVFKAECAYI